MTYTPHTSSRPHTQPPTPTHTTSHPHTHTHPSHTSSRPHTQPPSPTHILMLTHTLTPHRARLPQPQLHAALILGTRYTSEEAVAAQIINEASPGNQLLERAVTAGHRLAGKNGLDRATLANLKKDTYRDACVALSEATRFYSKL